MLLLQKDDCIMVASSGKRSKVRGGQQQQNQKTNLPQEKEENPLDAILAMCNGEIIPRIPNLQLLHFMLVYGHCGGAEGVCMDSTVRVECIQNRMFERHARSMTQNLSSARANNRQSKFAPNDWIDTFCKLMVDVNIGLPRIRAFAESLRRFQAAAAAADDDDDDNAKEELRKSIEGVSVMLQVSCGQCYARRMVDLSALKHPNLCVARHFPSWTMFLAATTRDVAGTMKLWAHHLIHWMCGMYESSCHCSCFSSDDDGGKDKLLLSSMLRVPSPKRMGLSKNEFADWHQVVTAMARMRTRHLQQEVLPLVLQRLDDGNFEGALVECWHQIAILNMEIVNTLLFYVSYSVKSVGETYIRSKLVDFFAGIFFYFLVFFVFFLRSVFGRQMVRRQ